MDKNKSLIIATGGTGGHIYPAIVTAEELRRRGWNVRFIGAFGPAGDKLAFRGFEYKDIVVKGFVSKDLKAMFSALICLLKACISCAKDISRARADVILGFGGYSSFPAVIAGKLMGVKTMIHEQNVCPGEANKVLGGIVKKVAISFKDTQSFFAGRDVVWTGYPMRSLDPGRSRKEVLRVFGLQQGRKTILVFGGSQGSRAINHAVLDCLEMVSRDMPWQVFHLAGKGGAEELRPRYAKLPFPFYLQDYMENMSDAYAVADLVIARSGAGTVTELGLLGVPAILIPYPYANGHQEANAQVLARRSAAVIIREKDLNPAMLGDKIFSGLETGSSAEVLRQGLSKDIVSDAVIRLADEVELL